MSASTQQDRLLTTAQVAELLGISAETARDWGTAGRLPGLVRLSSKCLRWRESAIIEHLARLEKGGGQ